MNEKPEKSPDPRENIKEIPIIGTVLYRMIDEVCHLPTIEPTEIICSKFRKKDRAEIGK